MHANGSAAASLWRDKLRIKGNVLNAQRLEGSRFIRWQIYRMAASGSRKLSSACAWPSVSDGPVCTK
jgi:hypothetical protein